MPLSQDERQRIIDDRKSTIAQRTEQSVRQLSDEVRMCRCGFKVTKSEAIRQGLKRCPRCGGDEFCAQSLDFNMTPDSVRAAYRQGNG